MHSFFGLKALVSLAALAAPALALNYNVSLNSQVRLAYAGPTGMMVSWNTFDQLAQPTVMYGLDPYSLTFKAVSDVSVTYNTSLTYNNHVTINNLVPNTMYYYMPSNLLESDPGAPPFTFTTARIAGDLTPYTIAVVVDMGTFGPEGLSTTAGTGVSPNNILAPGEQNTIQSLASLAGDFEFLLHPGDLAYADTWVKEARTGYIVANITYDDGYKAYESILDEYYDELLPVTSIKPYMVGPGNHEANCDNGGNGPYTTSICMPGQTNFTGYRNHFRMPSSESGGLENFWYSFDHGMIHYVIYDTETDLGHGLVGPDEPGGGTEDSGPFGLMNQQINWLTNDLANVDRLLTPWVVAAGHRPWYSSGSVCTNCQLAFEPLFLQYNVDMVLSGHFHVYERNSPIGAGGVPDPNELNNPSSPWYITNGAAGHYDGLDAFTYPLAPYQRFGLSTADGIYGWSQLTVHNRTHLTHRFIASNNNTVLDEATLYRDHDDIATGPKPVTSSSSYRSSSSMSSSRSSSSSSAMKTSSSASSSKPTSSSSGSSSASRSSSMSSSSSMPTSKSSSMSSKSSSASSSAKSSSASSSVKSSSTAKSSSASSSVNSSSTAKSSSASSTTNKSSSSKASTSSSSSKISTASGVKSSSTSMFNGFFNTTRSASSSSTKPVVVSTSSAKANTASTSSATKSGSGSSATSAATTPVVATSSVLSTFTGPITSGAMTTSTVFTTITSTITSCPATVTNCPTGSVVTVTVPVFVTVCPVTAGPAPSVTTITSVSSGKTIVTTSTILPTVPVGPTPTGPITTTITSISSGKTVVTTSTILPTVPVVPAPTGPITTTITSVSSGKTVVTTSTILPSVPVVPAPTGPITTTITSVSSGKTIVTTSTILPTVPAVPVTSNKASVTTITSTSNGVTFVTTSTISASSSSKSTGTSSTTSATRSLFTGAAATQGVTVPAVIIGLAAILMI